MFLKISLISLMGGLLCLDRVLIQTMVARPVVVASVVGLFLGDLHTGLITGAFLELIWIDRVPIGNYLPPNDTLSAILIAASAILAGQSLEEMSRALIALAVLLLLPTAFIAQQLDLWLVRRNEASVQRAFVDAEQFNIQAIAKRHRMCLFRSWSLWTGSIFLLLPLSILLLVWIYPQLSERALRGLTLTYGFIPMIGAAVALNTIRLRSAIPTACAVFLFITGTIAWMRGG